MTLEEQKNNTITGMIVQINEQKGFMFIVSEHPDYKFIKFFGHWSSLKSDTLNFKDLKKKMMVEFVPIKNEEHGYRANYIRVIESIPIEKREDTFPQMRDK